MKTVEAFEEWMDRQTKTPYSIEIWNASRDNMPIKTCEWYYDDDSDLVGCKSIHSMMRAHCSDCGGKVTIKPELTAEQKLEAMTVKYDALEQDLIRYMNIANDTEQMLAGMTKELDVQIANNKAITEELSAVTRERNRLCSRDTFMSMKVNDLQSDLNTAEKHLSELVSIDGAAASRHNASILVSAYIKRNGLDK